MLETEPDVMSLEWQCSQAVDTLLARYGWQLLDRQEFVRLTCEDLRANEQSMALSSAVHIYCQALHRACSGVEGSEQQNEAYEELFRHLYDSGRRYYPDVYAEAAQQAIEKVFSDFERCRRPGAFLAWALQCLRDVVRRMREQVQHTSQSLDAPLSPGGVTLADLLVPAVPQPDEQIIAAEQQLRLKEVVAQSKRDHPRADRQIAALLHKYIDGLDDIAIGQILGVSVAEVYVLRSRAIALLQKDQHWHLFAAEYGILKEE